MFNFKFNNLYESIIGDTAAHDAILKDVQIGTTYIRLIKDYKKYDVEMGSAPIPTKVKYKTVFSSRSEETARKQFEKLKSKVINKMGVSKSGNNGKTRE